MKYKIDIYEKCSDNIFGKVKPISNYVIGERYDEAEEQK